MKLVFLTGNNDSIIAVDSDFICHIDSRAENSKVLLGECVVFMRNGLQLFIKGTPKEVALSIIKQTEVLSQ